MRQENKERSSTIYIGKGIIISAIVITASLGFILGFFVGKSFRSDNAVSIQNASNIVAEQHSEAVQTPSSNHQDDSSTQQTESLNSNTTTATNQQLQSSQTLQKDKEQHQTNEKSIKQAQKNEQQEKQKTNHLTDSGLSNKNGKSKKYTVQVEAFKNQEAAEELKDKLIKKGYKAVVVPSVKNKNTRLYRVLAGEFSTRKEAEIMSIKMRKFEKLQHAFVTFK